MTERFAAVRAREFPWPASQIFMNSASFGPLPARTLHAVEAFNRLRHAPFPFDDHRFPDILSRARNAAARLIGASAEEIALGPNTSFGLNLAAAILARPAGSGGLADPSPHRRTIVVSDREFPANVYPWLGLRAAGFHTEIVPTDEAGWPQEEVLAERIARDDVACFALSAVQFSTGFRADMERLGAICRDRGVLFVVDGIQALGAVPVDVQAAGIDILSAGAQKWLCSPWGTGFTYVREGLCRMATPPQPGWLSFTASSDFTRLLTYDETLLPDARRFEVGSLPMQDFVGMSESVELILELGVEEIWEHIQSVQAPLLDWAERTGVPVVSDLTPEHRSPILCIRPPRAPEVHAALTAAGVVCVVREGAVRLSPHFFNLPEEMERVVEVLQGVLGS